MFRYATLASRISREAPRRGLTTASEFVQVNEVGARDGLQNIRTFVDTDVKINLINRLSRTGLRNIDTTSFVSPKWIPQLADNREVLTRMWRNPAVSYSVLTPNLRGLESALECGIKEVQVFTAVTDSFTRNNISCNIEESLERFKPVLEMAKAHDVRVKAGLSCVVGCPYEGSVHPDKVASLSKRLVDMGIQEINLGDTIGIGTPGSVDAMLKSVSQLLPPNLLALHFHDTYGQALANCVVGLDHGVRIFESSVSGLGGCPFAPGATGNVATEDLVYMLHGYGYTTGLHLEGLIEAGEYISQHLGRVNMSRVATATIAKRKRDSNTSN